MTWLFSIVLLRFEGESRSNFHSHAFNAWTWLLSGSMVEFFNRRIVLMQGKSRRYRSVRLLTHVGYKKK